MLFKKRIIIGGLPRAGTTLFRYVLDASPRIISGPETGFFRVPLSLQQARLGPVTCRLKRALDIPVGASKKAIDSARSSIEAFDQIMAIYCSRQGLSKDIWAEKTPWNCLSYSWLSAEDPEVYFISIIRDGRDVLTSKVSRKRGYHCSVQRYVETMRLIYSFDSDRHLIIRYEDMAREPETTFRRVFRFLKVRFDRTALVSYRIPSVTRDPTKVNQPKVALAITDEWCGSWQAGQHWRRVREIQKDPRVAEWLERSGYPA